jgi:metal-responsive CopG/Arc/MetJ family transcriptional regulator
MPKQKLTITIDPELFLAVQRQSKGKKISRSQLVEEILREWQKSDKRVQIVAGYKAMAKETLKLTQEFTSLANEVWPNG